jgi:hypothetical protein
MASGIAYILLFVLGMLTSVGNYWFTYGIWPKSWLSFVVFTGITIVLHTCLTLLNKES